MRRNDLIINDLSINLCAELRLVLYDDNNLLCEELRHQ